MSQQNEHAHEKKYPVGVSAKFAASTLVASLPFDVLAHLGPTGLLVGGLASYVAWKHGPEVYESLRTMIPQLPPLEQALVEEPVDTTGKMKPASAQQKQSRSFWDRAMGRFPEGYFNEANDEPDAQPVQDEQVDEQASDLFAQPEQTPDDAGVRRLTLDEVVAHTTRNSYEVYIGRSMTTPTKRAVKINIKRRHIKLIGASGYGKSTMAAFLMDAIMRTHDPETVMFSLLDLEHKTSRLFATADHLAEFHIKDQWIPAHARNEQEVLEHLGYIVDLMNYRYTMSEQELEAQPLLIVYLEEFVDLRDYFKRKIDSATTKEEKEQAEKNYSLLVFFISKIARRGLKVLIQFLLCAQVDYRVDDFQEALVNITSGMSFCVRPTAAAAAGFYQTNLIKQNALDNKKGQCVVEMPDCKDIILSPDYDLKARLKALKPSSPSPSPSLVEHKQAPVNDVNVKTENAVNALEKRVNASENGGEYSTVPENGSTGYSPSEEVQVLLAWGELQKADKPVTRTAIRDYLGWNNKQFTRIIKPVCDKHAIG